MARIFYTLREAQIIIESWRRHYNTVRPHASIGYRAPAPEVFVPALAAWPAAQSQQAPSAMLPLASRPTLGLCDARSRGRMHGKGVSIATPATERRGGQFVLHAQARHGNPFDGHRWARSSPS